MDKKVAIILGNFGDYAEKYLSDCLAGLRFQDWIGEKKIFIYDNASTDVSYSYLRQIAPEAEIIRNKNNDGFAKGNNDAIKKANQEYEKYREERDKNYISDFDQEIKRILKKNKK